MFGGHIPEEPRPAAMDMGDFGVKLDPEEDARSPQGRHRQRGGHHPRRRPRAL